MIKTEKFRKLKINKYFNNNEIQTEENWEFMGGIWMCAMVEFTQFNYVKTGPYKNDTGGISLSINDLQQETIDFILNDLDFQTESNYIDNIFGQPIREHHFLKDRITSEYENSCYKLDITKRVTGQVMYLTIIDKFLLQQSIVE